MGLVALRHEESSQSRDCNHVSTTGPPRKSFSLLIHSVNYCFLGISLASHGDGYRE